MYSDESQSVGNALRPLRTPREEKAAPSLQQSDGYSRDEREEQEAMAAHDIDKGAVEVVAQTVEPPPVNKPFVPNSDIDILPDEEEEEEEEAIRGGEPEIAYSQELLDAASAAVGELEHLGDHVQQDKIQALLKLVDIAKRGRGK